MNIELDEMALICMGSISDSKKSMNYLNSGKIVVITLMIVIG